MKDWTGNGKSLFTTLGASNHSEHQRENYDYYATDPETIIPLFEKEDFSDTIWEPACGEGHLSEKMKELGKDVYSTDLVYRDYGEGEFDFLHDKRDFKWQGDIITNPPYKYAKEFVEEALRRIDEPRKVAMFLKITFLEGNKRLELFRNSPPKRVLVFSRRQKCAMNGNFEATPSSAACYTWFVWEKGFTGNPQIEWI